MQLAYEVKSDVGVDGGVEGGSRPRRLQVLGAAGPEGLNGGALVALRHELHLGGLLGHIGLVDAGRVDPEQAWEEVRRHVPQEAVRVGRNCEGFAVDEDVGCRSRRVLVVVVRHCLISRCGVGGSLDERTGYRCSRVSWV